jgi:hypothetical protein
LSEIQGVFGGFILKNKTFIRGDEWYSEIGFCPFKGRFIGGRSRL